MATSNDVELWWDAFGAADGVPVILVPGRGDTSDCWPAIIRDRLLAAGFRVIVFDPRDAGLSGSSAGYDLADMADDVVAVLDAAGVHQAAVVGLSLGGMLTVDLASRHASRVTAAVFLSAMSPDPDAGIGPRLFEPSSGDAIVDILGGMGSPSARDRTWVEAEVAHAQARAPLRPDAGAQHEAASFRAPFLPLGTLSEIAAPTLVIHGTDDRSLPVAHGQALADGIAGARLLLIEGMGHLPTPGEWVSVADAVVAHLSAPLS
jgi:pimeloyl-ACP methyl ester carboxylesterase